MSLAADHDPAYAPEYVTAAPGSGRLAAVRRRDGSTVITRAFATSPLRLLQPRNHGRAAWVYTSSLGGGLVGGDRVVLEVDVGPGAAVFLSTQASTKVYRSARGATSELHARIGEGGLLAAVPDPVVCFASSRYEQLQSFDLDAGGALVMVDWLSSGRHARGERWSFDQYAARLRARVAGRPVLHDATTLRAADGDLAERMGRFDVLALVLILGESLRERAAALVANAAAQPLGRCSGELVAASTIGDGGCLLRLAGTSLEQTTATLRQALGFLPALLGDDPWARKW